MKRFICLMFTIVILATLVGCSTGTNVEQYVEEGAPITFVLVAEGSHQGYTYSIMYHKDTKVLYVVSHYNEFTVMVDSKGDPLLYNEGVITIDAGGSVGCWR